MQSLVFFTLAVMFKGGSSLSKGFRLCAVWRGWFCIPKSVSMALKTNLFLCGSENMWGSKWSLQKQILSLRGFRGFFRRSSRCELSTHLLPCSFFIRGGTEEEWDVGVILPVAQQLIPPAHLTTSHTCAANVESSNIHCAKRWLFPFLPTRYT